MNAIRLSRLWGTKRENIESLKVAAYMLVFTALYEYASIHLAPGYTLNAYEFIGTWTGLVCVWLSRTENILCWPWGIVSSLVLGFFFREIGLPGQEWLNWIYFTIVQIWAWPHWAFGGKEHTELPITWLTWKERVLTLIAIIVGTVVLYTLADKFSPGSHYPWLDMIVVAASVIAQYLLGKKKVENWMIWFGPVNLLSIILFFLTGAYTLTALYFAFLIHALVALREWTKPHA